VSARFVVRVELQKILHYLAAGGLRNAVREQRKALVGIMAKFEGTVLLLTNAIFTFLQLK